MIRLKVETPSAYIYGSVGANQVLLCKSNELWNTVSQLRELTAEEVHLIGGGNAATDGAAIGGALGGAMGISYAIGAGASGSAALGMAGLGAAIGAGFGVSFGMGWGIGSWLYETYGDRLCDW